GTAMKSLTLPGCVALLLLPGAALAQSLFDGTWKADLDKNKREQPPDVFLLDKGTYACKSCAPPYEIKADGKDHPVSGSAYFDAINIKVVNDHTVLKTAKKDGRTAAEIKVSISPDGNQQIAQTTIMGMGKDPVYMTQTFNRVAPGPAGSHVISGSWQQ